MVCRRLQATLKKAKWGPRLYNFSTYNVGDRDFKVSAQTFHSSLIEDNGPVGGITFGVVTDGYIDNAKTLVNSHTQQEFDVKQLFVKPISGLFERSYKVVGKLFDLESLGPKMVKGSLIFGSRSAKGKASTAYSNILY